MNVKECIEETILESPKAVAILTFGGPGNVALKFSDMPIEVLCHGLKVFEMAVVDTIKINATITHKIQGGK